MPAIVHLDVLELEMDDYAAELELDNEPFEPEDGDLTTADHIHFYSDGKLAFTVGDDENMADAIYDWMNEEGYHPNVWFISDHGNAHPIEL